ncbi:hypothetical protein [Novosphingobium sp.]|uniref:hypothetical protein n=1 Tax=Novosphingobium sp. TaxID=1874826 RepID=UPI0031D50C1A
MDSVTLRLFARIDLLPSREGGRQNALRGPISYRPNHNFSDAANPEMCIGKIDLVEGQTLEPGASMDLELILIARPELAQELRVGRKWRLQEGMHLVGWGTILSMPGTED